MRTVSHSFLRTVLPVVFLVAGCGGKTGTFDRVIVSGEVRFDGQPVPHGSIWFEPDISVGSEAPTGFATIRDGKFKTEHAHSPIAGKHLVRISGFAQAKSELIKDSGNDEVEVPPLFTDYTESVEIVGGSEQLQIIIPGKPYKKP